MTIEKATPTTLRHDGDTYAVIPSSTLRAIRAPEAVAILAYLLDRPDGWEIKRGDIMRRFTMGRNRYERAMRELRDLGLVWDRFHHSRAGDFAGRTLHARAQLPKPAPEKPTESPDSVCTDSCVHADSASHAKTDLLEITDTNTTTRETGVAEPEKPKGPHKLPENWYPSRELVERLEAMQLTVQDPVQVIAEFRDYWHSTGKRKKDWDRTFINRMKQQHAYEQQRGNRHGSQPNSTDLLANDLAAALASEAPAGW